MVLSPNLDFKKMVLDVGLTDKIKYCYQCNRCGDVCPVAAAAPGRYNPRALIMASYLGLSQLAIGISDNFNLWGCQVCDTCDEVCPNQIPLTEIFALIKNLSVQAGEAPEYYTGQGKMIYQYGKAIPMQPAIERRRDKMGLPKVMEPDVNELQTILKETKLDKKLKIEEESQ